MLRHNPFMRDEEMLARVIEVCERAGYGEVAVVIENGRPRTVTGDAGAMVGRADAGSAGAR